jgi:ubiquinone biosynthesis accessory factor UbiK
MLVRRAFKVQIPCHSKFQCSFQGLRAEAPSPRTILELRIKALRQMGAEHSEVRHMNTPKIDEIVRRLVESVPPAVRAVQQDLESNFRAVLRASLTKLDLVSRDEFDAQMRVLERTRARLEELERRVAGLDGGSAAQAAGVAGGAPGGGGGAQTAGAADGVPGGGGEPGPH